MNFYEIRKRYRKSARHGVDARTSDGEPPGFRGRTAKRGFVDFSPKTGPRRAILRILMQLDSIILLR